MPNGTLVSMQLVPEALQLSAALRALLDAKLDTLEKLEIALALRGAGALTIEMLARQLQVGPDALGQVAAEMARAKVVTITTDVVTLVLDDAGARLVDEASDVYKQNRPELMRAFSTIAMDRIRRMAARTFADAFQLRKKKDGDHG